MASSTSTLVAYSLSPARAGMGREGRTRDPVAWSGGWQAFPVEGWSVVILGLRVPWTLSQLFISAVVAESSR